MLAVLLMVFSPAAAGLTTVTTNVLDPVEPMPVEGTAPMVKVQEVPATEPSAQLHPAELPAALKTVPTGTVSVSTALEAARPLFA
jgi:hypothetical protein